MFTGGGSGGHITPIIAVARELRKNYRAELELYFLGAAKFSSLLKEEKIKVQPIISGKIRRNLSPQNIIRNIIDVFKTPLGFLQSLWYLFWWMPDALFSKGGYGSVPVVLAAWLYRIPILIHESDSWPGLANRLAAKLAQRIAVSFSETQDYFPKEKTALLGSPIRLNMIKKCLSQEDRAEAKQVFEIKTQNPVIFVMGGSQGGRRINEIVLGTLPQLLKKYEIIHQCGARQYQQVVKILSQSTTPAYHLFSFLDEKQLALAYLLADLVISQAGSSIFEIAACYKPSILIPLANSAGDHQRENAFNYARSGACLVIEESNLSPHLFLKQIDNVISDKNLSQKLISGAKGFARLDAAEKIARVLMEMAR